MLPKSVRLAGQASRLAAWILTAFLVALPIACRRGPPRALAIGEAFVGPATLNLRKDIPLESPTVATVKHGDRLEILLRRRRFMKVRSPSGAEGWTDERQLLGTEDMKYLKDLARRASELPVQGQATTYGELNVHTQPFRTAPSFFQIKEKDKVDVVLQLAVPRTDVPRKPLLPPPPKKEKAPPKRTAARESKYPAIPMPKPPGPPENWVELSQTGKSEDEPPPEKEAEPAAPIPTDEWSLVRNAAGQTGWVLSRRITMAIPDDVAQYAEGHRIVSYFPLGEVEDGDVKKKIWLWTTIGSASDEYDFDSFRVFIWSLRRHRYETAFIARKIQGHSPVLLKDVNFADGRTRDSSAGKYPGFSICLDNSDGARVRRDFALLGNVVRYAGERRCEAQVEFSALESPETIESAPEPPLPAKAPAAEGMVARIKNKLRSWFKR